jgi:hypothetical protein
MSVAKTLFSSIISSAAQALPYVLEGMTIEGSPHHDHVGTQHFADNARILFVNGVGSREHHCREKARQISKVFDDCRVDYVYVPLTFTDAHRAIKDHTEPDGSTLLLHTILRCNEELESRASSSPHERANRVLNGGERLICLLHSGGGATFESIRNKIPSKILDRIDIVTFGSAQLFHPEGFRSVRNFVASNDIVPIAGSMISRNMKSLFNKATHLKPALDGENSVSSHQFLSHTYQHALTQFRHEYDLEFSPQ